MKDYIWRVKAHKSMFKVLVDVGADVDATGGVFEETPLIVAAQFGYRQAVVESANIFVHPQIFSGRRWRCCCGWRGCG